MITFSLKKTLSYIDEAIHYLKTDNHIKTNRAIYAEKSIELLENTKKHLLKKNISFDEKQMSIKKIFDEFSKEDTPYMICLRNQNDISYTKEFEEEFRFSEE